MSKSMRLSAFYEKPRLLVKLFGQVSAGVMLFNMVLICCDVFMRYAFNSPIQGTTKIVAVLMAWVACAGIGCTLLKGQHMQLGVVCDRLHGRIEHIFSFFIYLLATILFVVAIKMSWGQFWTSWLIKEKSAAAMTVYVPIGKFGCFLGWLLLTIQDAFMTAYCIAGITRPNQMDPILIKSELPSEDKLDALGVERTQNAERNGDD